MLETHAGTVASSLTARVRSFVYAGRGIRTMLVSQGNARVHALATLLVVVLGVALRVSRMEWVALVLAIAMVWTAEALNTALEFVTQRRGISLDIRSAPRHDAFVTISAAIYAGRRPEDVPAYPFGEAALLAGVPLSTMRSWVLGRPFPSRGGQRWSQPVLRLPKGQKQFLSFTNLVEVHVLAAMRRKHALSLDAIRRAVRYVHDELEVDHPLANEQFKTNGIDLFVERLGELINASREGQLGMRAILIGSLNRVEYDKQGRAIRLFPLLRREDAPKSIVIDPRRAFGRPVVMGTSVPAADIRARFDAGDGVDELARDYDVSPELIEDALRAAPQAA